MQSLEQIIAPIQQVNITRHLLRDNGIFPNNGKLPVLVYPAAVSLPKKDDSKLVTDLLESNGWTNSWENGIYDYHHYHSITHEVLVIIAGNARVQLGGEDGATVELNAGDVIIIPAGVAHKNLYSDSEFKCVGAYPDGRDYDVLTGKKSERPKADENIRQVPIPENDPIYGGTGPLMTNWK